MRREKGSDLDQFRVFSLERGMKKGSELRVVVLPDFGLDGDCAGHRGLLPEDGSGSTEGVSSDVPKGLKGRGSDTVFDDHVVKGLKVFDLLISHLLDDGSSGRLCEHIELSRVDSFRPILSRVILSRRR